MPSAAALGCLCRWLLWSLWDSYSCLRKCDVETTYSHEKTFMSSLLSNNSNWQTLWWVMKGLNVFLRSLKQRKYPFHLCFCQAMHQHPLPPELKAGWHSDAIQDRERWEGLLYRPYGGEVRYLSSLSLSLSESLATMRFPHTMYWVWVSASPPRLSPFILNSDKERERLRAVGGGEEREKEGNKQEALGWKRRKMSERKEIGTWGMTERRGAVQKKEGRRKREIMVRRGEERSQCNGEETEECVRRKDEREAARL